MVSSRPSVMLGPSSSLDSLFRSAECTLARDKERSRFSEQWQSLVTPLIGPDGRELAEGSFREAQTVAVSHTLRAAYVYNPKSAHRSVKAMFRAASGKANCREPQPIATLTLTSTLKYTHGDCDPDPLTLTSA